MTNLEHARAVAETHLDEIGKLFRDDAKITLLIRHDLLGKDADFVLTSDELPKAVAALSRRILKAGGE